MKEKTLNNILSFLVVILFITVIYLARERKPSGVEIENARLKQELVKMSDSLNFTHRYCFRLSENEWKYCEGWTPDTCKRCKKLF